jgi:outer membrane receptor protein involved in Fe transport
MSRQNGAATRLGPEVRRFRSAKRNLFKFGWGVPLFLTTKELHVFVVSTFLLLVFSSTASAQTDAQSKDQNVAVKDLTSIDIEELQNLKVTTASLFADKLSNAPGIMSVVTSDELRRFGGMSLSEILQRVPGLTGSTQYFTDRSLVAARGDQTKTAGGHILFLINGRPSREVMEGGIISDLLESFPVEILERIEIIKGPGSVLYGSNAFSAVVNLITRKAETNHASVRGLGGVDGTVAASGHFLYRRGDFSATGAAQLREAPDWPVTYHVPPSLQNLPFAPHVPATQNVTVVDRGTGDYLGLNYKGLSLMSAFTEWQSTGFVQGTVGETRLTRDFGNLGYDLKVTQKWDMDFNLTYTRTTFTEAPYPSAARDSSEFISEWTNLITLTSKDRLSVGGLFNRIEGVETFTGVVPATISAEGSRIGGAFYGQIDHQLLHDVKLIAGFQTNKIGSIPLNTVPRAGMIWTPSPWASVKVLYGKAFRAPSLDENLLNRPGVVGNPNLLPETVETIDAGIAFQGKRMEVGADYFHSKLTNSIVTVAGTPARYMNLGQITFNGGEVEGKYYFQKDFFLQASMLYQTNSDSAGKTNIPPIPNFGFKAGLSYQNRRGLTVSLFDTSDGAISGYDGAANILQGSHSMLNGHLRYDISKYLPFGDRNGIAIVVHANNLTNHAVWLPGWGFSSIDTVPVQQGRVVYAGLEISMGKN